MKATPCPEPGQVLAFYRGELQGPPAENIAEHLAVCDSCRALLDGGVETVDLVVQGGQVADGLPPPTPGVTLSGVPAKANSELSPPGYRLLEEIGRGASGTVYRAHDVRLDRLVAIKLLRRDQLPGSVAALRFIAEARIAARLPHPGIPAIHEMGLLPDGRPFVVMRLVRGRTLQVMLEQRPTLDADRDRLLDIFHHICQAVTCAHAHRIIHRDLKPHNVMVGEFGEVQVMDWGLAKVLGALDPLGDYLDVSRGSPSPSNPLSAAAGTSEYTTRHGAVLGTPAYMPPEQAAGHVDRLDPRSDVFSLGAILCQILTGQPPYSSEGGQGNDRLARQATLEQALARLENCEAGAELVALCKRCLAINQADRPADARAVADEFEHIRVATQPCVRRVELENAQALGRQAGQCHQRRRLLVLLAVATCLLAVAGLVAALGVRRM